MSNQDDAPKRRISAAGLVVPSGKITKAVNEPEPAISLSDEERIGDLSLNAWDDMWKPVPQGFKVLQSQLRDKIGLFAAVRGDQYFYIGRAANMRGSGLAGGLYRVRGKNASGDKGSGMKMLRQHSHELDAKVITLDRSSENIAIVQQLDKAMRKLHDPLYNRRQSDVSAAIAAAYKAKG